MTDAATAAMRIRRKTATWPTNWKVNRFRPPMPAVGARDVQGGEAAHDPRTCEPIGELPSTRGGVWAPTGDPQDHETLQPQRVCQLDHVVGPIDQGATGLKVGETHARPVEGDQPDTARFRRLVAKAPLEPRSGPAVEEEERSAPGIAPFRIAQSTAVWKSDRPVRGVLHWRRRGKSG